MINHSFPGDKFFVFSSHYAKPLSTKYGKFNVKSFEALVQFLRPRPGSSGHVLLKKRIFEPNRDTDNEITRLFCRDQKFLPC